MTDNRIVKQVLETIIAKKTTRGRPRRTWMEDIRAVALKRGVERGNIIEATQDRKKWR